MNKSAIQKYAIWARTEMIAQVEQRAYQYGITADGYGEENTETIQGRALSIQEQTQRLELIQQIKAKGYTQVMEEVAYTWFNRFIALRFMEVNNYLPSHIRVFSDSTGAFKPEILNDVLHLDLPGLKLDKVAEYIENNQTEDLYRYLLLTQCNALNESLPRMFERMGGFTELLLPNNILKQDSVLDRMVSDIPEEDWTDQVQIIGWLYQYYISEKHNQVVNVLSKSTVKKDDIPAATQLFTTDWVVRYMVDNSLGRYWIERRPESTLREKLKYYIVPKSENESSVDESISPQELTFLDPCMGSGHILVYAFDVLMEIYKEFGYSERDAASEIVKNNLYGLDIDNRCSQLAYFAVMMKARSYDRRFLTRGINPHVIPLEESNSLSKFTHSNFMHDADQNKIGEYLIDIFRHAKEIGSLKTVQCKDYDAFQAYLKECSENAFIDLEFSSWQSKEMPIMNHLAEQAKIMSKKYCVVCTNPPYLNRMDGHLKSFVQTEYKDYSTDLFAVFEMRNLSFCIKNGYSAYMTPNSWMFLVSYAKLRQHVLSAYHISSFVHIAKGSFFKEATVDICAFVVRNAKSESISSFVSLESYKNDMDSQNDGLLKETEYKENQYDISQSMFETLPDNALAYWASENVQNIYKHNNLYERTISDGQNITGNNDRFLRYSWEVDATSVGMYKHWSLCAKGGQYRKWYGNIIDLIDWSEAARTHYRVDKIARIVPEYLWYKKCITWSNITSYKASFRVVEDGMLFEKKGASIFINNDSEYYVVLAMLNSNVAEHLLNTITQAISYQVRDIRSIPFIAPSKQNIEEIETVANDCIDISRTDWDSFEISWDFTEHPLVRISRNLWDATAVGASMFYYYGNHPKVSCPLELCYMLWQGECNERFKKLKENEEELNRIFIDIYGLQDELTPEVGEKDVTVRKADLNREIRSFISYAVGCMFGRYSIYKPGLAYAGGEWDSNAYENTAWIAEGKSEAVDFYHGIHFIPDKDNILPICEDDYFEDDIVGRFIEFVEAVYGTESLEANLKFIADALGGKGTPREVIRNYFLNDFYTDHLKIYQKRPIYWLFDSGKKNGFKALIYMHRYQSDLLARMRTDYVHEMQERYRTQLTHLNDSIAHASTSERVKLNKQLKKIQDQALELQKYEEKIHHLADRNISIDLDDGVKHNYALFGDVLAKIK